MRVTFGEYTESVEQRNQLRPSGRVPKKSGGLETMEALFAAGAFVGLFGLWVVVPSLVKKSKNTSK